MAGVLLDTSVLSEPLRASPNLRVVEWIDKHEQGAVICSISVFELQSGLVLMPAGAKRDRLERMSLATRNVRDFEAFGIDIVDPWQSS
jgi:hypothetical protein